MIPESTTKYRLSGNYVLTRVGKEAILAPVSDSVVRLGYVFALNVTAANIVDSINNGRDFAGIVEDIRERFDAPDVEALPQQIADYLTRMEEKGLISKE